MSREEAEEYAKGMTYRDAVYNALQGKCIPYRKATLIKLHELLDMIEPQEREKQEMTGNAKRNYDGKCGTCSYFAFYVKNGDAREQGRCCHPNRVDYHQASQNACKEYKKNILNGDIRYSCIDV